MTGSAHVPGEAHQHLIDADLQALERDEERLREVEAAITEDGRRLDQDLHHAPPAKPDHRVEMNYHQLTLHGHQLTGHEIKQQAIDAGVPNIKPNFQLTVERAGKDVEHTIGDDEQWTVHDGDCFTAVKPDDNS